MAIKTPQGSVVDVPRGTRDYSPREAIALNEIISVIEEVFKRHGFAPMATPAIETAEVLNAKAYGDEPAKQMYTMDEGSTALRFDLTVPLARYMAMNKDTPLPFKRYQIDRIWRREEPQRMRSREFIQADIDIVGSQGVSSDAECIQAMLGAIEALGIKNCALLLNSRNLLNMILDHFKVPKEKQQQAIRILDKMQKIGIDEVIGQLKAAGIDGNTAQEALSFINEKMTNDEKLNKLEVSIPESKEETARIRELISALGKYGSGFEIRVDLSLARGLDYYTGTVWEASVETTEGRLPSIASGGRYDGLMGIYSKNSAPAVGASIGVSRVFDVLSADGGSRTYAKVFIAQIGSDISDYSIDVANKMRKEGIYVDLNVTDRGISKQLEYSNTLGIRYVAIIGPQEKKDGKVKLRDMQSGTEELLDVAAAITALKK